MSSERINAEAHLNAVIQKATELARDENGIERGYAHLGWMILEVSEMRYWTVKFKNFRDYLKNVAESSKKSVAQLNMYHLTVRELSDTFPIESLEKMGITKAVKLRGAKDYALVLPQSIINAALDPNVTAAGLKKVISTELKMPEEDGDYMDCEMEFMVTPDQRALITETIDIAKRTEPLTKTTISISAQMLDVMLKLCMEFQ